MNVKELVNSAVYKAAEFILNAEDIRSRDKTDSRNIVTEYDQKVQDYLMNQFKSAIPDAHFFCEEMDNPDTLDAEHVFIIDPIDGTMNFYHGLNHSCISVAYLHNCILTYAAVYNPYVDELFTAEAGKGACLNGKPIHVSELSIKDSIGLFGTSPYNTKLAEKSFALAKKLFDMSLDIRRNGSAELDLCSVAAGRAGIYFELSVSLWDYAAGYLILREAGGQALTIDGKPLPFDASKPSIVAGSLSSVKEFIDNINN